MSVSIAIDLGSLPQLGHLLSRLGAADTEPLMTNIGAALESSTRERIEETKTSPDGHHWAPNRAGTSTLFATGRHLRDSVAFVASSAMAEVGASWEFAHVHQDGATIVASKAKKLSFMVGNRRIMTDRVTIPPRPFVGMSADDGREVEHLTTDFLRRLIGGAP